MDSGAAAGAQPSDSGSSQQSNVSSTVSSTDASMAASQQGTKKHGASHHVPGLLLGSSPSSSNTNLAGSPPGQGYSSIPLQPQQAAAQQQASQHAANGPSAAAVAGDIGLVPEGWERPFVIGVAGGTASGKTTVCDRIVQRLHDQCVVMLNQDSFYRTLTEAELADVKNFNFDHPDAFDTPALLECLNGLKRGRPVNVPTYDFSAHRRGTETKRVDPAKVIILEGILVLHIPELREQCSMRIYVDTDDDLRLARRIQRDVQERGRDVTGVLEQYQRFVKPAFDNFVAPSRRYADIIIPWQRGDNLVAIDLITQHIKSKLSCHELVRHYPNLEIMPSNFQIRGMHTIIRDATTSKNDFVFMADRLTRLVVEAGLGHLPFTDKTVVTPTGHHYVGVDFTRGICGVSIIRSGEAMETVLRECCQGVKLGKILVHRHGPHEEEEVVYERLPSDIASRQVLLMDPLVGTGRTACRAVEVRCCVHKL